MGEVNSVIMRFFHPVSLKSKKKGILQGIPTL